MKIAAADVGWFVAGALAGSAFALMTWAGWQQIVVR